MTDGLTDKEIFMSLPEKKVSKDIMTDGITVIEKDSQEKNKYTDSNILEEYWVRRWRE
jgi:hypothetical protein